LGGLIHNVLIVYQVFLGKSLSGVELCHEDSNARGVVLDILVNTLFCYYVCDVDLEQKMF
jgi:hypothetical protein